MKEMTSRYDGRCKDCGEDIEEGDRIGYDGDAHCGECLDIRRELDERAESMLEEIEGPAIAVALRCLTAGDRCESDAGDDAWAIITGHDRDDMEISGEIGLLSDDLWQSIMHTGLDAGTAGINASHMKSGYWMFATAIRKE